MTLPEKLRKLTEGKNRAQIARAAGVKITAVNNYIYRSSEPLAGAALRLARALNVDVVWLLDDSRAEFPPPEFEGGGTSLSNVSDKELMREVARRYRLEAVRLFEELGEAEKVVWQSVASRLLAIPMGEKLPPDLERLAQIPATTDRLAYNLIEFEPDIAALGFHNQMPGRKIDPDELVTDRLLARVNHFTMKVRGFGIVREYYLAHQATREKRMSQEEAEQRRQRLQGELTFGPVAGVGVTVVDGPASHLLPSNPAEPPAKQKASSKPPRK